MYLPGASWTILGAWVVLGAAFAGVGALVRRASRAPIAGADGWLASFWVGWAATLYALQLWHVFLPVDGRALALVAAVGLAGIVAAGAGPWRVVVRGVRTRWPAVVALVVVALWLANRALSGAQNGDSGLYHVPTIRWVAEHRLVPGLGNLSVFFADNQSYFLYAALVDVGPFVHGGHHVANALLLLVLAARVLLAVDRVARTRAAAPEDVFFALLLPAVVALAFDINLTSPSPDLAVFVLGVVLSGALIALGRRPAQADVLGLALVASAAVTVKLSLAALAAGTLAVALVPRRLRDVPAAAGIAALGLVPWIGRGVVLSGYPVYPSTLGAVPVAWRVPETVVRAASGAILVSQAVPGWWWQAVRNPAWVVRWLDSLEWLQRAVLVPVAIAIGAGLVAAIRRPRPRVPLAVLVPPLASFVFCLVTAPRPRFVGAALWVVAAETVLLALGTDAGAASRRLVLAGALGLALLPFFDGRPVLRRLSGFEPQPRPRVEEVRLESGLVVRVPTVADSCWDAPPPCAPHPDARLRLRRAGDLESGFVIAP